MQDLVLGEPVPHEAEESGVVTRPSQPPPVADDAELAIEVELEALEEPSEEGDDAPRLSPPPPPRRSQVPASAPRSSLADLSEVFDVGESGRERDRPTLPTGEAAAARAPADPARLASSERPLPVPPPLKRLPFRPSAPAPESRPAPVSGTGKPAASEAERLRVELDHARAELALRDARIQALELRQLDGLAEELARCDGRLSDISSQLALLDRLSHEVSEAKTKLAELTAAAARVPELEQRIAAMELARAAEPADDLRSIGGIGPAFERALRGLGVRTRDDLAAWSSQDVERAAAELKVSPKRIAKWVKKAQELAGGRPPLASGQSSERPE